MRGFAAQNFAQPVQTVGGGVAADAGVHHAPLQPGPIQILLQIVRIAVARLGAEACRETVAERHDHRPIVGGRRGLRRFRAPAGWLD